MDYSRKIESVFSNAEVDPVPVSPKHTMALVKETSGVKYIPLSWSELLGGGNGGFQNMRVIMAAPPGPESKTQNRQLRIAFGGQAVGVAPGEIPLKVISVKPVEGYQMSKLGSENDALLHGTTGGEPLQIKATAVYGSDPRALERSCNAISTKASNHPTAVVTSAMTEPADASTFICHSMSPGRNAIVGNKFKITQNHRVQKQVPKSKFRTYSQTNDVRARVHVPKSHRKPWTL